MSRRGLNFLAPTFLITSIMYLKIAVFIVFFLHLFLPFVVSEELLKNNVTFFFPDHTHLQETKIKTNQSFWRRINALIKPKNISIREKEIVIFTVYKSTETLGYIVFTAEMGMHKAIYFSIAISSEKQIKGINVVKYQETYGDEIKSQKFLNQYRGKTLSDRFSISHDIDSISGATISVEATNRAAKKSLAIIEIIKKP